MKNGRFTSCTPAGRQVLKSLTPVLFLFVFLSQTSHPGQWSGLGSSSLAPRDRRAVRSVGAALGGDHSNQHHPHHYPPLHGRPPASERHAAREERRCQGALAQSTAHNPSPNLGAGSSSLSSPTSAVSAQASAASTAQLQVSNQCPGSASAAANHTAIPSLSSRQPEGVSSSSESLAQGGGGGGGAGASLSGGVRRAGGEHHPPSQIPRAIGAGSSSSLHSLASRGSPSPSISSSVQASPPPPTPSSASSSSSSSSFTGRLGQPPRGPLSLHSYSRKNVFLQHSLHTSELQALTQRDS